MNHHRSIGLTGSRTVRGLATASVVMAVVLVISLTSIVSASAATAAGASETEVAPTSAGFHSQTPTLVWGLLGLAGLIVGFLASGGNSSAAKDSTAPAPLPGIPAEPVG